MSTAVCGHSTGSITGCRPLCTAPATHAVIEQWSGGGGPLRMLRCADHVRPTVNAAWPNQTAVETLERVSA